ncbi:metallophosphoesterase family protein [Isosphaeraceae bacterium EP7]
MRILVLSDIHANYAALAAIREPYDVCLCLGDLVDYGPDPKPCVRWAMDNANFAIRGNHDHGVAQGIPVVGSRGYRYLTQASRPFMWESLDADERRYLLQLPLTRRVTIAGKRFLLVHGTPRDPLDEYLMRDTEAWSRRVRDADADIVCVGHSHMQFNLVATDGTVVLNPGSVGQPRDGDPRAAYAIIEDNKISLRRIEYPIEETVAHIQASELPDRAKQMLTESYRIGRISGYEAPTEPDPKAEDEDSTD